MPIGFSDYQLTLIRTAARHVAPAWRSRFLEAVVDRLMPEVGDAAPITDDLVQAAVAHVLQGMRQRGGA